MTRCVKVGGRRRHLCPGDLDKRITLQNRDIVPPLFGVTDFTHAFTADSGRWANIQTITGKTMFDGVNQKDVALTHEMFVRYDLRITAETWILYDGRRFDIVAVEDLEERHEWQRLLCIDKGKSTV